MNQSYSKIIVSSFSLLLSVYLCTSLTSITIHASEQLEFEEITESEEESLYESATGDCGDHVRWYLSPDAQTLTISGTGEMKDYSIDDPRPLEWKHVQNIIVQNGVTGIGDRAFYDCASVSAVSLPDTLEYIGQYAFKNCSMSYIDLPDGLKQIKMGRS